MLRLFVKSDESVPKEVVANDAESKGEVTLEDDEDTVKYEEMFSEMQANFRNEVNERNQNIETMLKNKCTPVRECTIPVRGTMIGNQKTMISNQKTMALKLDALLSESAEGRKFLKENQVNHSSARSRPPHSAAKLTEGALASTQKHAQRLSKTTKKAADAKKRENRFLA
mmetsp:Transcript_16289/g.25367  ORF Transcript_16289/g.25367 Transcript_16289/m.25367 type:complete len:170 (-) Transcript_16289:893-1402(-)